MKMLNVLAAIGSTYIAVVLLGAAYGFWEVSPDDVHRYLGGLYVYIALEFLDRASRKR